MATFTNKKLNASNYMETVEYTEGRGKNTKTKNMYNFFDNRLRFLEGSYNSEIYEVENIVHLPNLTHKYYSTTSLWWVLARFNGIIFPLSEMKRGQQLYIPELQELSKSLNKSDNKTSVGSSHRKVTL